MELLKQQIEIYDMLEPNAEVVEWYTRQIQNLLDASPWGFESLLRYRIPISHWEIKLLGIV